MKKLRELYENCLGGICLATIFIACIDPQITTIANAIVMSIWVLPIMIRDMKEENEDV